MEPLLRPQQATCQPASCHVAFASPAIHSVGALTPMAQSVLNRIGGHQATLQALPEVELMHCEQSFFGCQQACVCAVVTLSNPGVQLHKSFLGGLCALCKAQALEQTRCFVSTLLM